MAYAMTKQGSLDNCVTYEFICDAVEDMNAIEDRYRTIGTVAIVLSGTSGLEVYIAGSDKQWNSLSSIGGSAASDTAGLSIYICGQDEVNEGVPDVELPDEQTLYLVPAAEPDSGNLYDEYIYVDGEWEKFGSGGSTIDLSAYATKADPVFTGSISLGRVSGSTIGENSVAEGYNIVASGIYSHAEGDGELEESKTIDGTTYTTGGAYGYASHIEGYGTLALNFDAHAEGYETVASGEDSHAEGSHTTASGHTSHAEGGFTTASETYAHAEGSYTTASGHGTHAEGSDTTASGDASHAEGNGELNESKTIDGNTYTTGGAYGEASHAEGYGTLALGDSAHAEGSGTIASGQQSHAEGSSTIASGKDSHVSGSYNITDSYDNWSEWVANTSYTVGDKVKRTTGSGTSQTINGYICKTANSDSTFTESKWNNQNGKMNYAEIIGNGNNNNHSNARALDWEGNEHLMGDIYVGCSADSTGGTKLPRIPEAPSTNGTYILQATVTNGTPTYSWVSLSSLSGVTF